MAERLNVLAKRVDEYEKLLQDVMLRSGPLDQARIKKILDQVCPSARNIWHDINLRLGKCPRR